MPSFGEKGYIGNPSGPKPSRGLFKEMHEEGIKNSDRYADIQPIYSLEAFRNVFLEEADFTEYRTAVRCVGNWEEWERIKRDWPGFCRYIEDWQEELKLKLKGDAFQKVIELLECGTKGVEMAAARFLTRGEWVRGIAEEKEKTSKRQDRKTEEAIEKKLGTQDDWERVKNVIKIDGGKETKTTQARQTKEA